MKLEDAVVVRQESVTGGYRVLTLRAPAVAAGARPGQFIHVLVPRLDSAVLRRPFSIFGTGGRTLSILYKEIGKGTRAMGDLARGHTVSVMGPLGNGFPRPDPKRTPVLVAGGYGVAPLCFLASSMRRQGVVFIGGASKRDVLFADRFQKLGWAVRLATEDGSAGCRGWVTAALDPWLSARSPEALEFFACGPDGMLRAVGERAMAAGNPAWLSLDKHMGCGVGACLACVQKIRRPDGAEVLLRVCRDGPVFEAREIVWGGGSGASAKGRHRGRPGVARRGGAA